MTGLIIYKSNYGATKAYANWISKDSNYKSIEFNNVKKEDIEKVDVVILGCPILAGKITMAKWINQKWSLLKTKEVILFSTSGALKTDPSLLKGFTSAFAKEKADKISYYPFGGRIIFSELKGIHSLLMKFATRMQKDPIIKKKMLEDTDNMSIKDIEPLILKLKKLDKKEIKL